MNSGLFTRAEDNALWSRVEDAGLNASAPPQQRWLDGWIVRFSPGKAKRARCVNAVAPGLRPVDDKLAECAALYREAGLPMFIRLTPFTQPAGLDELLAARGWHRMDETRVMVLDALDAEPRSRRPEDIESVLAGGEEFAHLVGALRGSTPAQVAAQAQRVASSPVPYQGLVWRRDGAVVACGQVATEGDLAGLYDIFTEPKARGQGLARGLCAELLARARAGGARAAYLQVEEANAPARAVYARLGFADAYSYHYRCPQAGAH